jgi:hypothetical protein
MAALCLAPGIACAQSVTPAFTTDNPNATVQGELMGQSYNDYLVPGVGGQSLIVSIIPDGEVAYTIAPDQDGAAPIFDSRTDGNDASVLIEADGTYRIHVFQTGEKAETDGFATYMLIMGLY